MAARSMLIPFLQAEEDRRYAKAVVENNAVEARIMRNVPVGLRITCRPRHPPHSEPALAPSSTAKCTVHHVGTLCGG